MYIAHPLIESQDGTNVDWLPPRARGPGGARKNATGGNLRVRQSTICRRRRPELASRCGALRGGLHGGLGLARGRARAVLPSGPLLDHLPEWVGWPPFWLDWFMFRARSGSAPTCSGKSVSLSSRSVC